MVRAVNPQQQTVENVVPSGHLINPSRQTIEIRIVGTDHDPGMRFKILLVQAQKMEPVLGQKDPPLRGGKTEDLFVRYRAIGVADFMRCQDIMSHPA